MAPRKAAAGALDPPVIAECATPVQARQSEALEAVRAALVKRWPDCKVHLFGSTANELSICNNNDIDICLELPDLPNDLVSPFPALRAPEASRSLPTISYVVVSRKVSTWRLCSWCIVFLPCPGHPQCAMPVFWHMPLLESALGSVHARWPAPLGKLYLFSWGCGNVKPLQLA